MKAELKIRGERARPVEVWKKSMKLIKDPLASPVLKERQLEVAAECSKLISTSREEILRHAEIRWQALTEELQYREPHLLPGLRTALHRAG